MMQWKASPVLTLSALTFSLLVSITAHAQLIEINPPEGEEAQEVAAPAALTQQPVAVSEGMQPAIVPQAQVQSVPAAPRMAPVQAAPVAMQSQMQQQQQSMAAPAASMMSSAQSAPGFDPVTGAELASGNSNASGTQINLNIQQDQAAKLANSSAVGDSALGAMRLEKQIRERVNDERLLEKLEEDRLTSERLRASGIENFQLNAPQANAGQMQTVPVASADAGAVATATGSGASATAIAVAASGDDVSGGNATSFSLTPMIGYRWYQNNNSTFRPQNVGIFGVALEGKMSRYFAVEGSFLYGRDQYNQLNAMGYPGDMYGGGYPGNGYGYNGGFPGNAYGPAVIPPRSRDTFETSIASKVGYGMGGFFPYVTGGVGYLIQKYNIDDAYTTAQLKQAGLSRTTDHWLANIGLGTDWKVSDSIKIGGRADYQYIINRNDPTAFNMNMIWGDVKNRYRLTASMQVVF